MLEVLRTARKVVGTHRLIKAIEAGQVAEAYVAQDADLFLYRQVSEACRKGNVPLREVDTMKHLGEACGIEVKTASCGILK